MEELKRKSIELQDKSDDIGLQNKVSELKNKLKEVYTNEMPANPPRLDKIG